MNTRNPHTTKVILIALAIFLSSASIIYFTKGTDAKTKREAYEDFLQNSYNQIKSSQRDESNSRVAAMTHPEQAAIQNYYMTLDPALGRVPLERLYKAYETTKELSGTLKGDTLEWNNVPAVMGGRTRAIEFDPNDPNSKKAWAGGVTGGLWYNNDITHADSSWHPVGDFWSNLSVSTIEFDPQDPQIIYVGTGEAHTAIVTYRESSGRGKGIWKSMDGGQTWSLLASTEDFAYVTDIAIREEAGVSVIYASVVSGEYKGSIHQSLPTDGLYRSDDGGNSWVQVMPHIPGFSDPFAIADIEVAANGRLFAGSMPNLSGEGGATILYSDSGTSGSWIVYDNYKTIIEGATDYPLPGRVMLSPSPADSNVVYGIIGSGYINASNGFPYFYGNYIIKSSNGGQSWYDLVIPTNITSGVSWATLAWHAFSVESSPVDTNDFFIGGLDVFRSTSSGQTWDRLSDWWDMYYGGGVRYVHADIHDFKFRPGYTNEMVVVTDGGVFYTDNANSTSPAFEERNKNYNTLQFYTCDIHPTSNYYVGGLQDNGTLFYSGSPLSISDMASGGDGAYCFFDDNDGNFFISSVYYNQYYVFYNSTTYGNSYGSWESGIFVNPSDYNSESNTLYANAKRFEGNYNDQLLIMEGFPNNVTGNFYNLNTGANSIYSHVKLSPHSSFSDILFIGTQAGHVFKVSSPGPSATVINLTDPSFPTANVSCIAIGDSNDHLLVTFSNYGVSSVWESIDGGTSWTEKEGNLPDMPVRWAIFHPENDQAVMLATETGIWTTDNISAADVTWMPNNKGLANVRIDMLQLRKNSNKVICASHGRGLFTTDFNFASSPPQANFVASDSSISVGWYVDFSDISAGYPKTWHWYFEGGTPQESMEENPENIIYDQEGTFDVALVVTNDFGTDSLIKEDYIHVSSIGVRNEKTDHWTVYPNPATDFINFVLPEPARDKNLTMYDLQGKMIYQWKINNDQTQIEIGHIPAGVYYLAVGEKSFKKVIIK